jgi:hypothetical protein
MKTTIAILAVALGASISLQGAQASDKDPKASDQKASLTAASQGYDLSAAKKKQRYVQADSRYVRGADGYYYPRAFTPGDPSWQSPDMLRRRSIGECIIDLGYGRWESCSNAGGRGRR